MKSERRPIFAWLAVLALSLLALVGAPAGLAFASAVAWGHAGGSSGAEAGYTLPSVDFAGLPASATVQKIGPDGKPHPVKARLLLDRQAVHPGETVRLGVYLEQRPGWHTYWRSPGDIGLPTDITWRLPKGATTTPYRYPVPQRFEAEGLVSYGYERAVLLFTRLSLPDDLALGRTELGAKAKWLVCATSCIPGDADLRLPVEVVAKDAPPADPTPWSPLFDETEKWLPVPVAQARAVEVESALSASAVQPEKKFQAAFLLKPRAGVLTAKQERGAWPAFAPIVNGDWQLDGVTVKRVDGGLLAVIAGETFALDELPTTDTVGGLFQVEVDGKPVRTTVEIPLPWAKADAVVTPSKSKLFTMAGAAAPPSGPSSGAASTASPPAPTALAAPSPTALAAQAASGGGSLLWMLLFAFVGGIILNVMPCVLPVLTLKLYSLVEQVDIAHGRRVAAGAAYSGGIVASFLALGMAVIVMKLVFGMQVGWGFQFQYPGYVATLATIVFVFGLSLFGVFEVPAIGADRAARVSGKEGVGGYFLAGIFATLLATPCSAPFLGTGMGFAFSLPPLGVLAFFTVAGLGLAAPFMLVAFVPALFRFLPKPGAWMETFKQLMGFTLIATTLWLVSVLGAQVGRDGMVGFLAFLLFVAVGAWIFGRWGGVTESGWRQIAALGAGVLVAAVAGWKFIRLDVPAQAAVTSGAVQATDLDFDDHIPWQPFSEQRVDALAGHTVFVDFTADWCLTCKVNEKTVLEREEVRQAMAKHHVVPLQGDWTRRDPTITRWLQHYGKAGVPFYLVIPADRSRKSIPLPEVITPGLVVDAIARASS